MDQRELAASVGRLERQVRLWKRLVSLLLVLVTVFVCGGSKLLQEVPDVVTAKRGFAVKDKQGRIRSFLGVTADGANGLSLFDERGRTRIEIDLTAKADDYGIYVQGDDDESRLFVGFRDGDYSISFYDKNKVNRLAIGQHARSGDSGLTLRDEKAIPRLTLAQNSKMAGISLLDRNRHERLQIYNWNDRESAIRFIADNGDDTRIALGVTAAKKARFSMYGNGRDERMTIDVDPKNSLKFEARDKDNRSVNLLRVGE